LAIESIIITIAAGLVGLVLVIIASRRGWIGGAGKVQIPSISSSSLAEDVAAASIQETAEPIQPVASELQPCLQPAVEQQVQPDSQPSSTEEPLTGVEPAVEEQVQPTPAVEVSNEVAPSPEPPLSIPQANTARRRANSRATRKTRSKRRNSKKG